MLDTIKGWIVSHGSFFAAGGLLITAVVDIGAGNYDGALKAALAAGGLLHLWSQSDAPVSPASPPSPA